MELQGRAAVVTGSARGIGKAIAIALARRGADIVVSDVDEEGALAAAREIEALGRRAQAVACNVARREEVEALVARALEALGRLDIFVNNAGITRDTLLIRMSEEQWDLVLDVNLKGTFFGCQAAARPMIRARAGKIVNVASITGLIGNVGQANYAASKAGVIALTRTAAKELASRNIQVNAIAPGFIETEMTRELPEKARQAFLANIPLARPGTPEDVAAAVCFLASPAADYITGQCLTIDGGLTIN
ncbi:MAG: 3-oxoacyl-[acyl-carrier-protein] reductase [Candidatus Eisenbacteria bacterium]|uniref:3-oxoacyl-[acyl-carrier-protein] reductase n=1 Tax=Eiseniibacteriota bacterium TaxID=2212470 RepID=A0A937X687_UNCEI|nr:3-oxoacyl-[acyl-carrier-protein] reductase [Candidatus Eisenbacteria bacterium]